MEMFIFRKRLFVLNEVFFNEDFLKRFLWICLFLGISFFLNEVFFK